MSPTLSEQEFIAAYDTHADALYRFALVHTLNPEQARDAVQEAFVRTWRYASGGGRIDSIRPFLYRTTRNILVDAHRQQRTDSLDDLQEEGFDPVGASAASVYSVVDAHLVLETMQRLPSADREVLTLRYVDDMDPNEIAGVLGVSANVVSVRIHRATARLRALIEQT